ncbi:TraB/GumN family protein [Ponticoccus sp. SC2-23]|uniref:TraB/GumN family protein n=1 Tax=Alexandriicola marinus TaxID=2081710 RepID=UPI000FD71C38|nr:TraB/GumN family protein [Alexandriicola marinus]MBM1220069.1 TraB/GumN family protein [Ponticoccus sp. SC6-9]MBM1224755.1 TraB/GumN family protein [Ponticoccus sp. SC6-15]MBM1228268.1 TraB/GumN family protein [Ponticoccus sp. SC6-38]MBM1234094.1 TraB/GumN family protein [Ponticoccus sp. SC6-45]MBM1238770.1 TraB/GumN family protein [Ponticoccus sp. SC6-49]MBM1242551.1 TraB/GumN family protein [Ponticoccus sp. SC2-64]MBM1247618.1 TraB/GumN family protein [Ponticoccus sp. SC6-42]MBM1251723
MTLFRAIISTLLCLTPALAQAACSGASLLDRFTPEQRAELADAAAATPYGDGLFWTARKDGREITLAGTMHLYDDRHAALLDRIADPLRAADILLVEMTPQEEAEMQRAMADDPSLVFITEGPTLPDQLPEELWQELAAAARDRQVPGFVAAKSQPWFLSMTLSIPPCAVGELSGGLRGLDHMIMDTAEAADVDMASLEDWRTLPDYFRTMSMDDQIDMLRMALIAPELQSEAFVAMLDSYFAGRVAEIWEMSRLSADLLPPDTRDAALSGLDITEDLLLDARNVAWIPVILDAAETHDRVFVAAGAAHLPGETGVLALLEQEGWEITPLP